jgi:hypothetical protein
MIAGVVGLVSTDRLGDDRNLADRNASLPLALAAAGVDCKQLVHNKLFNPRRRPVVSGGGEVAPAVRSLLNGKNSSLEDW